MLYAICLFVGFLVGGTGVGGILIPPALVLLSGLEPHVAMGTALSSFLPLDIVGTYLYYKLGQIDFRRCIPYMIGAMAGTAPGALFNSRIDSCWLVILLGLLIVFAGICSFRPVKGSEKPNKFVAFWLTNTGFFFIGAITGILAGMTGAGGPVLSIPWMVACGIPPMAAIGMSFPYSIMTALSGTIGNSISGNLDFNILPFVALWELVGLFVGVFVAKRMPVPIIKTCVGCICCILGLYLILREVMVLF